MMKPSIWIFLFNAKNRRCFDRTAFPNQRVACEQKQAGKRVCIITLIQNNKGRLSYKIFPGNDELNLFLKKNKDKKCRQMMPVFSAGKYKEYPHTEVRKLTPDEIKQYMSER